MATYPDCWGPLKMEAKTNEHASM